MVIMPTSPQNSVVNETQCGFPSDFNYFLLSMWYCFGQDNTTRDIEFSNVYNWGTILISTTEVGINLIYRNPINGLTVPLFTGGYVNTPDPYRCHIVISVDSVRQIMQVYINDQVAALSSGGWVNSNPMNVTFTINVWDVLAVLGVPPGSGIGDVFAAAPTSFFDLSNAPNRRKFINADLSPVDLQPHAISVLGFEPPIFLTVANGLAADFLTNYGDGGAFMLITPTPILALQPPNTCLMLTPTEIDVSIIGVSATASIGTLIGTAANIAQMTITDLQIVSQVPQVFDHTITLRWSDDGGVSYSMGVRRDLGAVGQYLTAPTWRRLGMARSRVVELSWSSPIATALEGAFVEFSVAGT